MTSVIPACAAESPFWDRVEPRWDDDDSLLACYLKRLKADLLPGTFILLALEMANRSRDKMHGGIVARIVGLDTSSTGALSSQTSVQVNISKRLTDFSATEGFLCPEMLDDNHLRHLPKIVQTTELRVVSSDDIMNLAVVLTKISLHDLCNMFFACQGMTIAFIIRFRYEQVSDLPILIDVPSGFCLPFPSSYKNSRYHDCFSSRIWNSVMCIKMEMTKILGQYSHQQGLFGMNAVFCYSTISLRVSTSTTIPWLEPPFFRRSNQRC